jgi:hypothetical protein
MRQACFITGFNNWGKSTIIHDLFCSCGSPQHRKQYRKRQTYPLSNLNIQSEFTVESHSNDDFNAVDYVDVIQDKILHSPSNGENLLVALCPAIYPSNNFVDILSNAPFNQYDKLHLFLIEYKYDSLILNHARLLLNEIVKSGAGIPNVNFIPITNRTHAQKLSAIQQHLQSIFP